MSNHAFLVFYMEITQFGMFHFDMFNYYLAAAQCFLKFLWDSMMSQWWNHQCDKGRTCD